MVTRDAGVSISWAPDPSGSLEHGMRHHREEEAKFRSEIETATPALEVLFDELESAGHLFTPPTDARFAGRSQRAVGFLGVDTVAVTVACTPALSDAQLEDLRQRVVALFRS